MARSETGVALIEVLVTSVVVGIAAAGIALMFSFGNTWVIAKGDDRVAMALALQRIEQIRGGGFGGAGANLGRVVEPPVTASGAAADRTFNRVTCVEYVSDTNFSSPAYAGGTTGTPCNATPPAAVPPLATPGAKRITVIVTPTQQRQADAPVVMQAWLTVVSGGI